MPPVFVVVDQRVAAGLVPARRAERGTASLRDATGHKCRGYLRKAISGSLAFVSCFTLAVTLARVAPLSAADVPNAIRAIAQTADTIVLARCIAAESQWDADGRVIVTRVTLAVERLFKGAGTSTLEVRTLGGHIGRLGMGASHAVSFAPGERVVAFLRRSTHGPYFVVASAAAGTIPVTSTAGPSRIAVASGVTLDLDAFAHWLEATPPW
jgi:hypothetical protein